MRVVTRRWDEIGAMKESEMHRDYILMDRRVGDECDVGLPQIKHAGSSLRQTMS